MIISNHDSHNVSNERNFYKADFHELGFNSEIRICRRLLQTNIFLVEEEIFGNSTI